MSQTAYRHNTKDTRIERDLKHLDSYEMMAVGIPNQLIEDRSKAELDALLRDYGFNLADKE